MLQVSEIDKWFVNRISKKISFVVMRKLLISRFVPIVVLLTIVGEKGQAQLNHFIYLQTDNQQPFYVKYNNRIISSSATGYLILSKLKEGVVDFTVGFPKSNQQEQQFQCTIDKSDKGFLIKNFNEKGWGLYDLQSSSVVYAAVKADPKINTNTVTTVPADDPFSNMLSKVTQDSTVKTVNVVKEPVVEKPVVVNTPKPAVTTAPASAKDSIITVQKTAEPEKLKEELVIEPAWTAPAKTPVKQIRKFESREGNDYVFEVLEHNGVKDTIRLFIEKDSSLVQLTEAPKQPELTKDTVAAEPSVVKQEPVKVEEKKDSIPVTIPVKEEVVEKKQEASVQQPVTPAVQQKESTSLPNSNCKDFATEDDLIRLRRRMASQSKDEQMINEAKKAFRNNCFTTAQLKNLSVLFLNDEGRYRFFDAAMPFVTDFSNFKKLGETITDEYYKKRFLALLPNQ